MSKYYTLTDAPIIHQDDDILNFQPYAEKIKQLIQHNSGNPEPVTIGIYGEWGQGKSSFLNLVERQIDLFSKSKDDKGIIKYHFNPWMYGTQEEMLYEFFDGLGRILRTNEDTTLQKAGKFIEKYSKYLKCIKLSASIGISEMGKGKIMFEPGDFFEALGEDLKGEEATLLKLKEQIDTTLKEYPHKIVVFIDDLDRLDKDEIYILLKIIKLNANFQNLVYLITLDHTQVAKAIKKRYGNKKKDGSLFLEKIINIPIHLPKVEGVDMKRFFEAKLNKINKSLVFNDANAKKEEFTHIFLQYNLTDFKNPREIIRLMNSFFVGAFAIGDEVNLKDLFWIEYLKLKHEQCYHLIKDYKLDNHELSKGLVHFNIDPNDPDSLKGVRKKLKEQHPKAFPIVSRLFPHNTSPQTIRNEVNGDKYFKSLSVNHVHHFDKYFSYHTKRKISRVTILQLKDSIKEADHKTSKELVKNLINDNDIYATVYEFEQLLYTLEENEDIVFLVKHLLQNYELFPHQDKSVFSGTFRERMLDTVVALFMERKVSEFSKELLKELGKLPIDNLVRFTKKYSFKRGLSQLGQTIADKVRDYNLEELFILDQKWFYVANSLFYWKDSYPDEFSKRILETLNSKENLGNFIRNFANYMFSQTNFFTIIKPKEYKYLDDLIGMHNLYTKIQEYYPELVSKDLDALNWYETRENSIEDNILQILYYYKKSKEPKEKKNLETDKSYVADIIPKKPNSQ